MSAESPVEIDVSNLSATSLEVMGNQATINIGTVGHVAHGKSTLVRAISGVQTVRFKNELERNITIRLGYANAKIYKCDNEECPRPDCYASGGSGKANEYPCERPGCKGNKKLIRHVSFVDCPGHDILMATMLSGAAVMDAALLLVAANESCPQPQTSEHLAAVEIMQLKHIIIMQNKVDLITEEQALSHYDQIRAFIKGTVAADAPIIPISAQLKFNVDAVAEYLTKTIPVPVRDYTSDPHMIIVRSFDINKPGTGIDELKGGIAGGSILKGVLRLGDEVEIRPGRLSKSADGSSLIVTPYRTRILDLRAEENGLKFAVPGGLIGVGTRLDPAFSRGDRLVGNVLGWVGKLPKVFGEIEINFYLLRRLLGVKSDGKKQPRVDKLSKGERLMLNIGSTTIASRVSGVKADIAKISLDKPACATKGDKVALSRRIGNHWRLIGWATITKGKSINLFTI